MFEGFGKDPDFITLTCAEAEDEEKKVETTMVRMIPLGSVQKKWLVIHQQILQKEEKIWKMQWMAST